MKTSERISKSIILLFWTCTIAITYHHSLCANTYDWMTITILTLKSGILTKYNAIKTGEMGHGRFYKHNSVCVCVRERGEGWGGKRCTWRSVSIQM